jgi:hypothetical protein
MIKSIAEQLEDIIEREASKRNKEDRDWQGLYSELAHGIIEMKDQAQVLLEDMRANGLTASSIEAEGYLRACIQASNLLVESVK